MNVTSTDRDLSKLNIDFKEKVDLFLSKCKSVFVTEGFRSKERQKYLYSKGRTIAGSKVTWTLDSMHCKGLAIDIGFFGAELYPKDYNKWREVFDIAAECGIDSGYDLWGRDLPHLQNNDSYNLIPDIMQNEQLIQDYKEMTIQEMSDQAKEWDCLKDFRNGLKILKKPLNYKDFRDCIAYGRILGINT